MDNEIPPTRKPFYLVLDFEANCSAEGVRDHEIIEFPAVLVDARRGRQLAEFRQFVHTVKTGPVSTFIERLTGITTQQLKERAVLWSECLRMFDEWCDRHGVHGDICTVVTCGDWDLKTMLPRQLNITHTQLTPRLQSLFGCWNNVKHEYRCAYGYRRMMGMENMLEDLKVPLVGRHHSGIDDTRNIATICVELMRRKGADVTEPNRMLEGAWWWLTPEQMPYRRTKRGDIIKQLF